MGIIGIYQHPHLVGKGQAPEIRDLLLDPFCRKVLKILIIERLGAETHEWIKDWISPIHAFDFKMNIIFYHHRLLSFQ